MPGYAKEILKKYKEGGKVEEYKSDLLKEVEGMGPEGKRYLKDKLQGKKYEGELRDEYKHDLDKELEGMSEKGKEELKKLLGVDDDPWKDVKEELDGKKKDKKSIGELMAYSEEGYAKGGEVEEAEKLIEDMPSKDMSPWKKRGGGISWTPADVGEDEPEPFGLTKGQFKELDERGLSSFNSPEAKRFRRLNKEYKKAKEDAKKHAKMRAEPIHFKEDYEKEEKRREEVKKMADEYAKGGEVEKSPLGEDDDWVQGAVKKPRASKKDATEGGLYGVGKKADNWIQGAVKKPGALRAEAKKDKLIKGDEKLSAKDLNKLGAKAKKGKNSLLMRRVNLAKVFAKMRKKK